MRIINATIGRRIFRGWVEHALDGLRAAAETEATATAAAQVRGIAYSRPVIEGGTEGRAGRALGGVVAATAVLLLATLGSAENAGAAVYCAPSPCTGDFQMATIEGAVTAADGAAGADTVAIKSGTYNTPQQGCGGLFVNGPNTTVTGAGIGETVLTFPQPDADFGGTRTVICGHMDLQDLTLRLPSDITPGLNSNVQGIDLYSGSIRRVRVDAPGAEYGPGSNDGRASGMLIRGDGTVVQNVEVAFGLARDSDGISTTDLPGEVKDVTVRARNYGFTSRVSQQVGGDPMRVERLISRSREPLQVLNETGVNSEMVLSDSLLDASGVRRAVNTHGVTVVNGQPPEAVKLTMDRVTIVGNRSDNGYAMGVFGQGQPRPTVLKARHVIATGFRYSLLFGLFGGDAKAIIGYSNVNLSPRKIKVTGDDGDAIKRFGPRIRKGDPLFKDPEAHDFRLRSRSPAVDIGGADLVPGGPADLGGDPRPADGDGDGVSQNDAGAYERQPH